MKIESKWRYSLMSAIFLVIVAGIFVQLVKLQFSPQAATFLDQSERYSGTYRTVNAPRGTLYDRWGKILAGNSTVYEVGISLRDVEDEHAIAFAVNAIMGQDYEYILSLASIEESESAVYAFIADNVPYDQANLLIEYMDRYAEDLREDLEPEGPSLVGLEFRAHLARSHPEDSLASPILGIVALDEDGIQGYHGIEEYYDELLAGASQSVWIPSDPNLVEDLPNIPPGTSLILTIDRELQVSVENIIDQAVEDAGAKSGTVLVMHPKTGEILAMASTPRLNPNEFWRYAEIFPAGTPFNPAISRAYEPGSVFKVFTMAAALDAGIVTPETTFFDTGSIEFGGIIIKNWDNRAWGEQNMLSCLQNSLNVCLASVAKDMKADIFYDYLKRFGFGQITGIDLAGEVTGRLKEPGDGDWYPADLGANSFGQGIAVTPIQMMMAVSALANDGKMVVPRMVRSIVDGESQYDLHPQFMASPISAETARTISEMLAQSMENEASLAVVPGYRCAGKTGTAEIPVEGGYSRELTNASFVGWGPVDDPQFIVYIWVEEPTTSIWGSVIAAPIFNQVVSRLVVLMDIPPDNIRLGLMEEEE